MVSARSISVQLKDHKYEIIVQPGLLADVGTHLRKLSNSKTCAIISDDHVGFLFTVPIAQSLRSAGFEFLPVLLPRGEDHKTIASVNLAYDQLLRAKIERSTPILALGGGVIGDTAG